MREALFIKRNAEKWQQYQDDAAQTPDEEADRFITLLDDLAYSRTHYPQSKVTRWINSIATNIYQSIYQNRKEKYSRLRTFWTTELPLLFLQYRRVFLLTLLFTLLCIAVGVISSAKDDQFVRSILGEEYVNMTEDNIMRGDPFGVYRDDSKFNMFITIAFNNVRVAFVTCLFGLAFGLGTIQQLFNNGIMIGSFEEMFFAKGLGAKSMMVIWLHGTIEIWSLVIAGAAGFIIGTSFLFPGSFTRMHSFKQGVKNAIKILMALIPFIAFAAFIESFITYQMSNAFSSQLKSGGMPIWMGALILIGSVTFIVWYFFLYPEKLGRRSRQNIAQQNPLLTLS